MADHWAEAVRLQALLVTYDGMLQALAPERPAQVDPEGTSPAHLRWMLAQMATCPMEPRKFHRWLGFVQHGIIALGLTTVQAERDRTRPLFRGD